MRELHGYTPWYFNLPDPGRESAWKQLLDPQGFAAPFGLTTAERRHPKFAVAYAGHECQWNGPSWPYATSVTLTALANLLNNYNQRPSVSRTIWTCCGSTPAQHRKTGDDTSRSDARQGNVVPWIDEDLDPFTGIWLAREPCCTTEGSSNAARTTIIRRSATW